MKAGIILFYLFLLHISVEAYVGTRLADKYPSHSPQADRVMRETPLNGTKGLADTDYFSEGNLQATKRKEMEATIPEP
jgi:hypothetical protein